MDTTNHTCNCSTEPVTLRFTSETEHELAPPAREGDVGYDLTLISAKCTFGMTTLYDTGIKVELDHGYYLELFPKSSISKTGYMLANSVGVIDNKYRGNILVPLIKIDPTMPDLVLPKKVVQLVIKKSIDVDLVKVDRINVDTERGEGGFGSTT